MAQRWRLIEPTKLKTEVVVIRGFRESALADKMGRSRQTISTLFNWSRKPRLSTIEALMDETGMSPFDLFELVEVSDEEIAALRLGSSKSEDFDESNRVHHSPDIEEMQEEI